MSHIPDHRQPPGHPFLTQIQDRVTREAIRALQERVEQIPPPDPTVLTQTAADALYAPARQSAALRATGTDPLNVDNLRGVLADPQSTGIRVWPEGMTTLPAPSTSRLREILTWKGVLYYFSGEENPGVWRVLSTAAALLTGTHATRLASYPAGVSPLGLVFWETDRRQAYVVGVSGGGHAWTVLESLGGSMPGTLNPNTKPGDLGTLDTGFRFLSTDYAREYRWNGSGWEDAPGAPARYQFGLFNDTPDPGPGWLLCDGATGLRSTNDGGLSSFTPPDLIHDSRTFRTNTIAGGTGGAASGDTDVPSATIIVQAGTGVEVATLDHTHPVETISPYYNIVPYIRV